jgi:hypothetical protein
MHDKVLIELAKLIKVPNLHKILEKNATGLKWKIIKMVFKRRKNDSRFVEEKSIILALRVFGLLLFPNPTGIISLEAAVTFVAYENTKINPTTTILEKSILTLNHCRSVDKGSIRCCEQLLYI